MLFVCKVSVLPSGRKSKNLSYILFVAIVLIGCVL